ncbi:MAG: amidohydrolase family protein [Candidatus Cloacimonetes bacterium]|nr:amidohydrolase family protein [Candidatus Cloacimonadota bacterium]
MIKIKVNNSLHNSSDTRGKEVTIDISNTGLRFQEPDQVIEYNHNNKYAYAPLINAHDHLIRNWFPRSGIKGPYANSHIWIEENLKSDSFLERDKIWQNDGNFDLTTGNAKLLALLGMYKNIFSGIHIVSDHVMRQKKEYYDYFDIHVIKDYTQCYSLFNDFFGESVNPEAEMEKSKGIVPFIIHLADGIDHVSKNEFKLLVEKNLLKVNTLLINGIALEKQDFQQIADAKASICWCPSSNMFLIGKTLDVMTALEAKVNITIGTGSTMAGGHGLFEEFRYGKRICPQISAKQLYDMATKKAEIALLLYDNELLSYEKNLLILDKMHDDIYENILYQDIDNIDLLVHQSKAIYGNIEYFEALGLDKENFVPKGSDEKYEIIKVGNKEKFVIGSPSRLLKNINDILGYKKKFPYLPI